MIRKEVNWVTKIHLLGCEIHTHTFTSLIVGVVSVTQKHFCFNIQAFVMSSYENFFFKMYK